ncbi:hypothetical protein JCM6882_008762 [Rhodosporidiobolus microsporus]
MYRVQCATYNGHLARGHNLTEAEGGLGSWLGPALSSSTGSSNKTEEPDFIAVGFQELLPLHAALAGLSQTSLALTDSQLQTAIDSRYSTSSSSSPASTAAPSTARYTRIARHSLGGIALLVYARKGTVAERVQRVELATAGCGMFGLMGNKGAVGVRVTLVESKEKGGEKREGDGTSVFTFVTAHLAAHQSRKYVDRRNADWRNIVERLVFIGEDGTERQLFDTGNVFFFGDLNYRISLTAPVPLSLSDFSTRLSSLFASSPPPSAYSSLLLHDQLTQERTAGRALHHLREGAIAFPPSYKFVLGTSEYTNYKKRVPSWTDRVLYASAGGENVKVESYRSVMDFERSDHKPVTALFSLPPAAATSRLPCSSPFPIDPSWHLKKALGYVLDRLVGSVWCIVMLAGFNRDARVGLVNLLLAALTAYYRRYWM